MVGSQVSKKTKVPEIIGFLFFLSLPSCQSVERSQNGSTSHLETRKQMVVNSLELGQTPQALNEISTLARQHPKDPEVLNLQGLVHLALRNGQVAVASLEKARKLDPDNLVYALNLSSALIEMKEYERAQELLMTTLKFPQFKTYSHRDRLLHNLGVIAEYQGNSIRAERWYSKALQENPASFITLLKIAKIYEQTHRRVLAVDRLETAKAACPRCPEPVEALVRLHLKQNKLKTALETVENFAKNEGLTHTDAKRINKMKQAIARHKAQSRS
jgi:tetratricopeptide (TPR) repeat protein